MLRYIEIIASFIIRDIPIHIINLFTSLLPNHLIINRVRGFLIKPFLGKCGKRVQIGRGVIINNPKNLLLGDDCYISHYCYIQAKGVVTLGNNVIIGPMSVIASSNHIIDKGIVTNSAVSRPITIGSGTWCGAHVIITSGITIGESVVIAAGAVVTKNIVPKSKVAGIPAKEI